MQLSDRTRGNKSVRSFPTSRNLHDRRLRVTYDDLQSKSSKAHVHQE